MEPDGGSVTVTCGTDLITATAPPAARMVVGFYDDRGCYFDGEVVQPGETRVIAPRGSYFATAILPERAADGT
jgi:hypothetical protein